MTWQSIWITLIFSVVGYLLGSISFSILISRWFVNEDIRMRGSGNAGATNALRAYGPKFGIVVLILDMSKPMIAVGVAMAASIWLKGEWNHIMFQGAAFGSVIGHIYPIFFGFKGGKGGATYAGFLFIIYWPLWFIGFALFVIIVYKTKIVSLGTVVSPFIIILVHIILMQIPHMNDGWSHIISLNNFPWWVTTIFITILALLVLYTHKGNIGRVLLKTERKLVIKAKK
ncbi:glycerol-3-phosphate 1-O-acyltransferase PlsY [Candidatus Mycoplasma mahonii]|uniref:glycerol-3-phosphate 1-O-acyltransferase PlsY n=1 Tax=Candidatus Mycoplasma mahonii TaxID=3004105 RepID=UPI0026E99499|nr:glycerol-3-phosphate 1-O-acyltransferase PlsY [Candidatus Mycoplasma mahonii]WKX02193.1 glycerol-3-phosphate 1-O-acyltransferase PlsY [Candidatus Mycoplasma mahonii]